MPRWLTLPVCILPHKPVSGDAVGEDRVDCRRLDACPYDRTGTRADCGQRLRLACPRQRVRLEGAGEEIEQANLKLFARSGGDVVVPVRGSIAPAKDRLNLITNETSQLVLSPARPRRRNRVSVRSRADE